MRENLDYSKYTSEDFCQDLSFIQWVRREDSKSILFWDSWLQQHPNCIREVEQARDIIIGIHVEEPETNNTRIDLLKKRIDLEIDKSTRSKSFVIYRSSLKIAASLAFLVLSFSVMWWIVENNKQNDQALIVPIKVLEKKNNAGEKSIFRLPDGSKITLNAESKLSYPENFSGSSRNVELEGEAFFEVVKDASRPFIISSGEVKTTVLGTSFNIRAYPSSNSIKVAVSTGKVLVKSFEGELQKSELTVIPNEMTVFEKDLHVMKKSKVDPIAEFGWKDGIIHFKNAGIDQVIGELSKWYGVKIVVDKEIKRGTDYTGTFDNKPLSEVLEGVGFVFGFNYEIDNKNITIN
ncbi:MAG: FecR domain-containing protein [Reichenbachiella sp.]